MNFPEIKELPSPVCIKKEDLEWYRLEKWEFYPLPECVSTFFGGIPNDIKNDTCHTVYSGLWRIQGEARW